MGVDDDDDEGTHECGRPRGRGMGTGMARRESRCAMVGRHGGGNSPNSAPRRRTPALETEAEVEVEVEVGLGTWAGLQTGRRGRERRGGGGEGRRSSKQQWRLRLRVRVRVRVRVQVQHEEPRWAGDPRGLVLGEGWNGGKRPWGMRCLKK